MHPSEEMQVIRTTLRYVAILLFQSAEKLEKEGAENSKIAIALIRGIAKNISKQNPINVYNMSRSKTSHAVDSLVEKAERNVNAGKGENP